MSTFNISPIHYRVYAGTSPLSQTSLLGADNIIVIISRKGLTGSLEWKIKP